MKAVSLLRSLAILSCLAAGPAGATSSYEYGKNEYNIIRNGLAPNKQLSLASHGEGQDGVENFHVWLMAEPAHRKIMALDNISTNSLNTAADAIHAFWTKDSRRVAVTFLSGRYQAQFNLYRVENRRIHLVSGPDLFKEVVHRDVTDEDNMREQFAVVKWHEVNRFKLTEYRSFVADEALAKLLGAYGHATDKLDVGQLPDGKLFITFYVNAECEIVAGDRYKVMSVSPGSPKDYDGPTW